jgi:hypothetical protein
MRTMTWVHTRKGTPMSSRGTWGALMLRAMMIRQAHPNHPVSIDGQPV